MDTFTVIVHHTNRARTADGGFVTFIATVQVGARDHIEASMVAAQMVAATRQDADGMVIGTDVIDGPI